MKLSLQMLTPREVDGPFCPSCGAPMDIAECVPTGATIYICVNCGHESTDMENHS